MRFLNAAAIALVPGLAQAIEPVADAGNFAGVCRMLQPVASASDALVEGDGSPYDLHVKWYLGLYDLAFSAETRNTVDADDLDPLVSAGESVLFMSNTFDTDRRRQMIRPAVEDFGRKYKCRIKWDD